VVSAQRLTRATPSGRLRLATWNLENLHAQDGQSTSLEPKPSVKRMATDYERIRCYVRLFDPDILAVQEVDGEAALSRVVDTEVYDVHVDDRPKGSLNGQQNTGFAVKRGLTVVRQPDFEALDIGGDGRLRYGARIDLAHNGQTLQLKSVKQTTGAPKGCTEGVIGGCVHREVATGSQGVPAWATASPCSNHTGTQGGVDTVDQPQYNRATYLA
jgi:hypothetical protein